DRNRSHWSTSKTPSYTKSVSWQHHPEVTNNVQEMYKEFFYTSYFKLIIPFLLIISYFMSSISVAIMSFVLYVIIRRRIGKDFFSEIKMKRLKKEDIMGLEHVI
ncbi:cytosine permease, partial [Escherichia coli]|uniref:cytosine permease n=1 Tax=Escherichia coli TaxID=562 RepID=UPI00201CF6A3